MSTTTTARGTDNWLGPPLGMVGGRYGMPFAPGWSLFFGRTGDTYFPLGPAGNYDNGISSIGFATIYARNVVANFHLSIPHHRDAGPTTFRYSTQTRH